MRARPDAHFPLTAIALFPLAAIALFPLTAIALQVVFISGGVWTIGYKAWGAFFGRILALQGIVTVMADYRNFPQGRVQHMMQDVDAALSWVHNNIHEYGGDPQCIHLMGTPPRTRARPARARARAPPDADAHARLRAPRRGRHAGQSAGAHLAAMVALFKAREEAEGEPRVPAQTTPTTATAPAETPTTPGLLSPPRAQSPLSPHSPAADTIYFTFTERHLAPDWRVRGRAARWLGAERRRHVPFLIIPPQMPSTRASVAVHPAVSDEQPAVGGVGVWPVRLGGADASP